MVTIPSKACLDLIKESEGLERKLPYGNIGAYANSVGIWTIGYGSIYNRDKKRLVTQDDVISAIAAENWLKEEVNEKADDVNRLCTVPLTQGMFDALVSFTYSLGTDALKISTLLRKLNDRDYEEAAREFGRWIYGIGEVLPELVNRRDKEEALFRRDGFPGNDIEISGYSTISPIDPLWGACQRLTNYI